MTLDDKPVVSGSVVAIEGERIAVDSPFGLIRVKFVVDGGPASLNFVDGELVFSNCDVPLGMAANFTFTPDAGQPVLGRFIVFSLGSPATHRLINFTFG